MKTSKGHENFSSNLSAQNMDSVVGFFVSKRTSHPWSVSVHLFVSEEIFTELYTGPKKSTIKN